MEHTVGEVARMSGQTVRTLHHYDQIGLLAANDDRQEARGTRGPLTGHPPARPRSPARLGTWAGTPAATRPGPDGTR